jgi:glycosyltransferase involved in cell wall biosynthesis
MSSRPYFSVVIISYNGATTLGRTIESLLAQTYDQRDYEIIVVDDGSTDATAEVAAKYAVRYHHQANGDISKARNTGIQLARGEVYVCMDRDIIVAPHFLKELATAYRQNDRVAGIGGVMARLEVEQGLTQTYIGATGHGLAPRVSRADKSNLFKRLRAYLMSRLASVVEVGPAEVEVEELYGANGSFPMAILKAVGGWDVAMSGIEDRDLCHRIKTMFPDHKFIAVRSAKLIHDPDMSIGGYMLRGWKRGPISLVFYQRKMMMPPIFPFPVVVLAITLLAVVLRDSRLALALVLVPQVLYFWWAIETLRRRKLTYLLFPYLQLTEESLVIMGLLRGYLRPRGVSHG